MGRIAVMVRLKPGVEAEARRLLADGPPFDPNRFGFDRHDVYIEGRLVVFVFEGPAVETRLPSLAADRGAFAAFASWAPLLESRPQLAHEAYYWTRKEETMKRILIATDGSPAATEAVEFGLELAAEQDATVTFVKVIPMPDWERDLGHGPAGPVPSSTTPADYAALNDACAVADERGIAANSELIAGDPVDVIVSLADSIEADMIVIGSRGRGAVAAALLGSVSRGVLHSTRRPVVVVRGVRTHAKAKEPVPV
jgi:nucleotide-binding universal stress UspA family protein